MQMQQPLQPLPLPLQPQQQMQQQLGGPPQAIAQNLVAPGAQPPAQNMTSWAFRPTGGAQSTGGDYHPTQQRASPGPRPMSPLESQVRRSPSDKKALQELAGFMRKTVALGGKEHC